MSVWRYRAVPLGAGRLRGQIRSGELAAETAADARASLRRIGLQALELRPVRARVQRRAEAGESARDALRGRWHAHLRRRRGPSKAEMYDGLATMLESGLPLLEVVGTLAGIGSESEEARNERRPARAAAQTMLVGVHDALRSGSSLADALETSGGPAWFDSAETAMVRAGLVAGTLPEILRTLADRQQRSGELSSKLLGALAYPAIVAVVGLGVAVFLSVKTLPELVAILEGAKVRPPGLTLAVMAVGQSIARWWWLAPPVAVAGLLAVIGTRAWMTRSGVRAPERWRPRTPRLLRTLAAARLSLGLAEMLRAGVPAVESLRALERTLGARLRPVIQAASTDLERGRSLSQALRDPALFDAEFRRTVAVGEASGELETLLERIGRRYERAARRRIDRLAGLLEPAVVLVLAVLVGSVVMAAVLPLVRLQEVI